MQVAVNRTVSYEVAKVDVGMIRITLAPKLNVLQFQVMYRWLGTTGQVIRAASNTYLQTDIEAGAQAAGHDLAPVMAALRALVPVGSGAMLTIFFDKDGALVLMAGALDAAGGPLRFVSNAVTDEALATAGVSRATLQGVVAVLAQALT